VTERENVEAEHKKVPSECEFLAAKRENPTAESGQLKSEHGFLSSERV